MHINPSDLTSTELRAIVALNKYGKPAMISSGFVIVGDVFINWKTLRVLNESNLLIENSDGTVELTNSGKHMAKQFMNRPILGYD